MQKTWVLLFPAFSKPGSLHNNLLRFFLSNKLLQDIKIGNDIGLSLLRWLTFFEFSLPLEEPFDHLGHPLVVVMLQYPLFVDL